MPLSSPFTDQLSAWSTLGGAVGSVLAVIVAGWLLLHEIRSRNEERREQEANQARRVTVMVRPQPVVNGRIAHLTVSLANYSDGPITEIELVGDGRGDKCRQSAPIIEPGRGLEINWALAESIFGEASEELLSAWFGATARFTDMNGRRWQRCNWDPPVRWPPSGPSRRRRLRWWVNRRKLAIRNRVGAAYAKVRSWLIAARNSVADRLR